MKIRRKILGILLTMCLVAGLVPATVLATNGDSQSNKTIMLGTSQMSIEDSSKVYLGTYKQSSNGSGDFNIDPISWSVLNNSDDSLFLFSEKTLDIQDYNDVRKETAGQHITWENCSLRTWLNSNFMNTAFTDKEQAAIAETQLVNSDNGDFDGGNDTTDKIFVLSVEDAQNTSYFSDNASRAAETTDYVNNITEDTFAHYWLRNPGSATWDNDRFDYAATILGNGTIYLYGLQVNLPSEGHMYAGGIRPAFNLNSFAVLFSSAADGGKISNNVGADSLRAVTEYTGNEWKLTLSDNTRNGFTASTDNQTSMETGYSSWSIDIEYSGAQTGNNEYVSALLCDSNDNVLYYGNIAQNSASGTATLNLPTGLDVGNYTLNVFSEQCNGDNKTDYASVFQSIPLSVNLPQENTPNAGINYVDETLTDLTSGATYLISVGGGQVTEYTATGNMINIQDSWFGEEISIVKKGDDTTTSDSEAQKLTIPSRPATPALDSENETFEGENDGTITIRNYDVDSDYEISANNEKWRDAEVSTEGVIQNLPDGNYRVRVKAVSGESGSFASVASDSVTISPGAERTYILTITAPTFSNASYGYDQPDPGAITIKSEGNSDTVINEATLSGEDSSCFTLNKTDGSTVAAGSTDNTTYTISPISGLLPGTYTATIQVTYSTGGEQTAIATADVEFSVSKAKPAASDFIFTAPDDLIYDGNGKTATITVKDGIEGMGTITVKYFDADGQQLNSVPTEIGDYAVMIDVEEGDNYLQGQDITDASWIFTITEESDISAATGDDSNVALWAGILVLAAAVATGIVIYGRKKKA